MLLLDEPDSALDYNNLSKHLLLDTVRSLCGNRERTGLLTMHDVNLAMQYCTRLVLLVRRGALRRSPAWRKLMRKAFPALCGIFHPGTQLPDPGRRTLDDVKGRNRHAANR